MHWTSGIELGIRLISLAWIRRLLDGWPGAADLFEHNELAVRQIWWHQQYLAAFRSRGSSANNHVIAEAAGQLVASCAFPWFPESERWRRTSARLLERELVRNTFPSGINRELASDYQCFVAELGSWRRSRPTAAVIRSATATWQRLCRDGSTARRPWSTSDRGRRARATATTAGRCCSTRRRPTGGRRCSRSARRSSAASTGGRRRQPEPTSTIVGALAPGTP